MQSLITVVLPVFAIMGAGFLAGRLGLLDEAGSRTLNIFVFNFALPPLLFIALARVEPAEILNWPFILAFAGAQFGTFALALGVGRGVLALPLDRNAMFAMAASYPNTGHMGIPLALVAFGDAGALPAILATVITASALVAVVLALVEAGQSRAENALHLVLDVVGGLARNPLLVAPVAGLVVSFSGLPVPRAVESFCEIIGQAAGPAALFSLGLFLATRPKTPEQPALAAGRRGELALGVVLKMVVQPVLAGALIAFALPMPPLWAAVCVMMAALPVGVGMFVVAQRYQAWVAEGSAVILVTTVLSVPVLAVLIPWLAEFAAAATGG